MSALLLVAHGSRREASNDEVRKLTEKLRSQAGKEYATVECAFLELAQPSIPDGIACCVRQGATEVVVLPYFLSAGRHVSKDIPEIIEGSQSQYPDVTIRIAPYLGTSDEIIPSLLQLATK